MSQTSNGSERGGTPRTLVSSVIRAFSSMTPAGRRNSQREIDRASDSYSGDEISAHNPRARPLNEHLHPSGSSADDLLAEANQFDRFLSSGRQLTDNLPTLENSHRDQEANLLTPRTMNVASAFREQIIGEEQKNQNLLTDCQPTSFGILKTDTQLNEFVGHSSSSVPFAHERGEISPSFRPESLRGMWGQNALASSFPGDKDTDQNFHFSSFRGMIPPPLKSSDCVADLRRYPRESQNMIGDPDSSQRRGRVSLDNITKRDSKRPSARPRDRDYNRRFSVGLLQDRSSPQVPLGGNSWPREDFSSSPRARNVVAVEFDIPTTTPVNSHRFPVQTGAGRPGPADGEKGLITSDSSVPVILFNIWCGPTCRYLISSPMPGIFLDWILSRFHWSCFLQHR